MEKDTPIIDVVKWFQRDSFVIFVLLFAILACLYTIHTVQSYQVAINRYWQQQWEDLGCDKMPLNANITFKLGGNYDEIKDRD